MKQIRTAAPAARPLASRALAVLAAWAFVALAPAAAQAPGAAALAAPAAAAGAALSAESRVDWEGRNLLVRVVLDLAKAGIRLPGGRLEAERLVERELPSLVKPALFALGVDSWRDVGATVADGELDINGLIGLAASARRESASFARDMRTFEARYAISLSDVARLYIRGQEAVPLPAPLGYTPSRAYTGIVIYAEGPLPVRGERVSESLRPCLFPRIYDEDMVPVLERRNVEPAALAAWGPAGYAEAVDAAAWERVGDDPLRVIARAVFGTNRTDIVLSREDAARILALPENRALVARGRVLVVLGLPR